MYSSLRLKYLPCKYHSEPNINKFNILMSNMADQLNMRLHYFMPLNFVKTFQNLKRVPVHVYVRVYNYNSVHDMLLYVCYGLGA